MAEQTSGQQQPAQSSRVTKPVPVYRRTSRDFYVILCGGLPVSFSCLLKRKIKLSVSMPYNLLSFWASFGY